MAGNAGGLQAGFKRRGARPAGKIDQAIGEVCCGRLDHLRQHRTCACAGDNRLEADPPRCFRGRWPDAIDRCLQMGCKLRLAGRQRTDRLGAGDGDSAVWGGKRIECVLRLVDGLHDAAEQQPHGQVSSVAPPLPPLTVRAG